MDGYFNQNQSNYYWNPGLDQKFYLNFVNQAQQWDGIVHFCLGIDHHFLASLQPLDLFPCLLVDYSVDKRPKLRSHLRMRMTTLVLKFPGVEKMHKVNQCQGRCMMTKANDFQYLEPLELGWFDTELLMELQLGGFDTEFLLVLLEEIQVGKVNRSNFELDFFQTILLGVLELLVADPDLDRVLPWLVRHCARWSIPESTGQPHDSPPYCWPRSGGLSLILRTQSVSFWQRCWWVWMSMIVHGIK